jgi:predicted hotdog family 3-hydroxylacyl-ACP dehydratase
MNPLDIAAPDASMAGVTIEALVPHRGSMLLLDRLVASDEDSVVVEGRVREGQLFATAQGLPSFVGIEYMAQAVAAWAGCRAWRLGRPARVGFLLGTRRFECTLAYFAEGALLRVYAYREVFGDNGLGMFACRLWVDDELVAEANLSVYEPPGAGDGAEATAA